ncbi:MAG: epoxide hydrolase [Pseudomonadales bacterium]|nr:epoxide hydrolase [Pseudomonadales bacterium]
MHRDENSGEMTIAFSDAVIDDLRQRLERTRWPDELSNANWEYGTNMAYLKGLVAYWTDDFDWHTQEAWLNSFANYKTDIDGLGIHYVHARSSQPDAIPLLLLHGWPSSFIQMLKIIPMLTDPRACGLMSAPAFHVVAASLPGYGFSDAPTEPGMGMEKIAGLMSRLMTDVLGYKRYGARGSDLGATVIDQLARHYPEQLMGLHLTGIIVAGGATAPDDASAAERQFLEASAGMALNEMAYARQHASKPQTLALALNDSPAGMASWIIEKYRSWGDTGGDIESRFSRDYLLTTLTSYWVTQSIAPSIRLYYEMVRNRGSMSRIEVPTGLLMAHKDLFPCAPREWAQRTYHVVHWSETHSGGHFLEWEEPTLLARDIQTFFGAL